MTKKEPASVLGPLDVVIACVGAKTLRASWMRWLQHVRLGVCILPRSPKRSKQLFIHSLLLIKIRLKSCRSARLDKLLDSLGKTSAVASSHAAKLLCRMCIVVKLFGPLAPLLWRCLGHHSASLQPARLNLVSLCSHRLLTWCSLAEHYFYFLSAYLLGNLERELYGVHVARFS